MAIKQIFSEQKKIPDLINLNYTDESGILWHLQLPYEKAKNYDAIMQCDYRTYEETFLRKEYIGIFSIVSSDISKDTKQKSDFVFPKTSEPARKSNPESDEITVQDYLNARSDIKKIAFSLNTTIGCWYTDTINVQELPETMSSLMHLFVDNAGLSAIDNTILNIYLLTKESEHKKEKEEQKQEKEKKQEDVKKQKEVEKIFAIVFCAISCSVFITFAIGAIVGALSGWHGVSLFNISGVDSIKKVIANIFIGSVGFSSLSVLFWVIITYFVRRHFSSTSQSKDLFDQVFKK